MIRYGGYMPESKKDEKFIVQLKENRIRVKWRMHSFFLVMILECRIANKNGALELYNISISLEEL